MLGRLGFRAMVLLVAISAMSTPSRAQIDTTRPRRARRAELCRVQPPADAPAATATGPSALEPWQATAGGDDVDPCARRSAIRVGLTYDYNVFNRVGAVAGDQPAIRSITADDHVSGYGAFLDYYYNKHCPWYWGVDYHTSTLRYVQSYDLLHTPARVDGSVKGSFLGLYTGYDVRLHLLHAKVSPHIGLVRAYNRLTAREFNQQLSEYFTGYRTEVDYKTDFGANIEVPLFGHRGGVRLSTDYTTGGGSKDADTYWRVGVGGEYRTRLPF